MDHDGTRPAEIYRSETFTVQWRDRLLRIDIGYPLPVDPGIELMIRGAKPVPVYVLDSWTNFPMAVSTTRLMQWGGEVPPCLVVGIGYADIAIADRDNWRTRDLTPTTDPGDYQPLPGESFGAGPDLRRFLLETLRPMVERRFDIDASRAVLCGHSLGGLFVLDTMVQTPGGFGNYLAISPSLWFGRTIVLKQLAAKLSSGVTFPARVAVFAGEQEERISEPRYHM